MWWNLGRFRELSSISGGDTVFPSKKRRFNRLGVGWVPFVGTVTQGIQLRTSMLTIQIPSSSNRRVQWKGWSNGGYWIELKLGVKLLHEFRAIIWTHLGRYHLVYWIEINSVWSCCMNSESIPEEVMDWYHIFRFPPCRPCKKLAITAEISRHKLSRQRLSFLPTMISDNDLSVPVSINSHLL